MANTHGKDYLNRFKLGAPVWLVGLIDFVIATNGKVTDEQFETVYQSILTETALETVPMSVGEPDNGSNIRFKSLKHNAGVNALHAGELIRFSDYCTILYGMNGAGKSSYFKILNEVVGGNEEKVIHPNIYSGSPAAFDVDISYSVGSTATTIIKWDDSTRDISPLNKSQVFDYSYLDGLLSKRTSDSSLLEPFGLHLFTYIIDKMDQLKGRLLQDAADTQTEKPTIDTNNFSDDLQNRFSTGSFTGKQQQLIEQKFQYDEEIEGKIKQSEENISKLKEVNIGDKIKLCESVSERIESINEELSEKYLNIKELIEVASEQIEEFVKQEQISEEYRKSITALESIPNASSDEWKGFVVSAQKYSELNTDNENDCPYCLRQYDDQSINLVKAYGSYLTNTSEVKLREVNKEIEASIETLQALNLNVNLEDDIKQHLKEGKVGDTSCVRFIEDCIKSYGLAVVFINQALLNKTSLGSIHLIDISLLTQLLEGIVEESQTTVAEYGKDKNTKEEEISKIGQKLAGLKEAKSIFDQSSSIEEWFQLHNEAKKFREIAGTINTRALSTLSKTAHKELLTEKLKTLFVSELEYLFEIPKFEVELVHVKVDKGTAPTKLVIANKENVREFLSEGEQKAVALALFLAEVQMQSNHNPIILDDPVNSLDHKIAANFAERLMSLENQIIIFTHNKLFVDAFESTKKGHICKNIQHNGCNTSNSKHVFLYSISSDGRDANGIVTFAKLNKAKVHIKATRKLFNKHPFDEAIKVAALIRKTVECIIDEHVLNNIIPRKMSNKNNPIAWNDLKELRSSKEMIDQLHRIHGRCSGGSIHNGTEENENPIGKDEYVSMLEILEGILGIVYEN